MPFDLEKCKSIGVTGVRTDGTDEFRSVRERKLWRDQKYYRQARAEGSQPWGTSLKQSTHAMAESDKLGRAFRADKMAETYHPDVVKELTNRPPITRLPTGEFVATEG